MGLCLGSIWITQSTSFAASRSTKRGAKMVLTDGGHTRGQRTTINDGRMIAVGYLLL